VRPAQALAASVIFKESEIELMRYLQGIASVRNFGTRATAAQGPLDGRRGGRRCAENVERSLQRHHDRTGD
jgi:hypothetical protein